MSLLLFTVISHLFWIVRKTYSLCATRSLLVIIIFLVDAPLTGNISVVYGPIPVKFSAHKARLMLFLMTPKRITNTLPVQSYFPFPNFLTAILCHQRLWGTFKKAKNEHRNLKYKHWNCAGSSNLKIGHLSTKKGRGQNVSLLKTWNFDPFFLYNFLLVNNLL